MRGRGRSYVDSPNMLLHPCQILQECIAFGGFDKHQSVFLKSPSNIGEEYLGPQQQDMEDQEYEDTFTEQCENGHIACAPCCIKVANKCPSCCFPIGYNHCRAMEKVLESVKVSCVNKRYGCKEILSCSKKTDHENACMYVPCSCPFRGCDFVGTSTKVYAHFSDKHASSAEHIFFNAVHPIYIEKHQHYQILQIRTEGILFIINQARGRVGNAINIICVGPDMQKRRFSYELVVTDGESSFKLESVAESIPNWSKNIPLKKFLLVPRYVINSSARLKLDVFIAVVPESCCRC